MNTFRCDGCGAVVDRPVLRVERVDDHGGDGVRVDPGQPWDLCVRCSRAVDHTLADRRAAS